MDSTAWAATFAGVSALGAIATAGVAAWTLGSQRRDSRDRTRPVVVVSMRTGPLFTSGYVYLVVANRGRSVARNLTVRFDPLPSGEALGTTTDGTFITIRYRHPISLLAPGQQLTNIYRAFRAGAPVTPDQTTVTVTYNDDRGRTYRDTFDLDVTVLSRETWATPGTSTPTDHRAALAAEAAAWELWQRG